METLSSDRCPAARPDDKSACIGAADAVMVTTANGKRVPACTHHGTILLASLDDGQVRPGPASVPGTATTCHRQAQELTAAAFLERLEADALRRTPGDSDDIRAGLVLLALVGVAMAATVVLAVMPR